MIMLPLGITQQGSGGSGSTLLTNLVSWWSMDETSGTRADSHGSNDLSDINTVTQASGKVGNSAQFTRANTEYLENTAMVDFDTSVDWTFATWVYLDSSTGSHYTFKKANSDTATAGDIDFMMGVGSNDKPYITLVHDGSGAMAFGGTNMTDLLSMSTWYFLVFSYELSTKTMRISINAGTEHEGVHTGTRNNVGDQLRVGQHTAAFLLDGRMDESAFWPRLLTSDERTELYNSGNGIGYSSL